MNYKKGGISFITGVILSILLVAILSSIVFRSTGISVTSIVENIKKLVNIETPKAEAGQETKPCTIKRYYWSPNKARFRDEVNIVIEGEGTCNDKEVTIYTYESLFAASGAGQKYEPTPKFKENKIVLKWYVYPRSTVGFRGYYFKYQFGNQQGESDNLEVIQ